MYERNVSKLLITMVESNFISAQDYESIVCSISDYIPGDYEKGDEVSISPTSCPNKDGYDSSYGLDIDGWAYWKGDAEKNKLVLVIDSPEWKVSLDLTTDEISEIWQGYCLEELGKKLAIGYIEKYISSNDKLTIEGLNGVIPGYGGLCYAELADDNKLLVVFDHDDFYIEHFFPNILTPGTGFLPHLLPAGLENELHATYRCNCVWRLT
jgi:hypothetical protein